jgi:hypothetical protein
VFNVLNTSARAPGNPEVSDEAHRVRLYEEVCRIMQEVSQSVDQLDTLEQVLLGLLCFSMCLHMPHCLIVTLVWAWVLPGMYFAVPCAASVSACEGVAYY